MTLKTLKDLEKEQIRGFDSQLKRGTLPSRNYCWSDELKAEAVKWFLEKERWLKPLSENANKVNSESMEERERYFQIKGQLDLLIHFFNLTEEDLK